MKKFLKVVLGTGLGVATAVSIANIVDNLILRKKEADVSRTIEGEVEETKRIIYLFKRLNKLSASDIMCEDEDGGIAPIFCYNRTLNLEHMRIPKGYELLKIFDDSDSPVYAIGKKSDDIFVDYHIIAYLVDDWYDDDSDLDI